MTRGGYRPGSGRPPGPTGKAMKTRSMRLTDEEYDKVREYIKKMRSDKDGKDSID